MAKVKMMNVQTKIIRDIKRPHFCHSQPRPHLANIESISPTMLDFELESAYYLKYIFI